jgi:Protein of unknown function (DUF2569)
MAAPKWVSVPAPVARRHPLYGVKGWLIVLAIALALSAIGNVLTLAQHPLPARLDWAAPATALLLADKVLTWVLFAGALLVLGLLLLKSRHFPRALQAASMLGVGGNLGDMAAAGMLQSHGGGALDMVAWLVPSLVFAALWVPYVARSARVNVTYRNRVPRGG